MNLKRTPAKRKAKELAKHLWSERPDYNYLRSVFRSLREELEIEVTKSPKKLPDIPTESEIENFYTAVWKSRNFQDMVIIKLFLYTGIRVGELVKIRISDLNFDSCQIRINEGKGKKDRIVPFPASFREILGMHLEKMHRQNAIYLFESTRRKSKYTDRGIRKIMEKYVKIAGIEKSISPHMLRHFLMTWLKRKGIDDALIQPYSGHSTRQSLEIYSKLSIREAQEAYDAVISDFPV